MSTDEDEERALRVVALLNVQTIRLARQRAEQELLRTKEALEEETRILELLNEIGTALASQLELSGVMQTATRFAAQLGGAEACAFLAPGVSEGETRPGLHAAAGPRAALFASLPEPSATLVLDALLERRQVLRCGLLSADSVPDPGELAFWQELGLCSLLLVPVSSRSSDVLGTLVLGHRQPNAFSERAERLVVGIAAQASIALDNARLYEVAQRNAEERERLLSAERAARVEVERAGLMKDQFLSTLSHELRTPLNAILGWSEVLLTNRAGNALQHGLEIIARSARAQSQLIDDLLDMNRIVSGKIRLDVRRTDFATVVLDAVEAVRPSADAKNIRLRTLLEPRAGLLSADPARLHQIAWNLLTNAIKFTPAGGQVDVGLARVERHVELTVRDSGIGIPAEFLPHVFERFRQADSSNTRSFGGLGLGLAIVKQFTELHGGHVRAASEGEGRGATIIVSLPTQPLQHDVAAAGPLAAAEFEQEDLSDVKVLVVEDDPSTRELLRVLLESSRARVWTAGSAEEALRMLREHRPDVLLSDIGMPGSDGYELIRTIRGLPASEGGRTPAAAVTAFARSEDRTRAMLAGFQVHVSKPIDPAELIATVRGLSVRVS